MKPAVQYAIGAEHTAEDILLVRMRKRDAWDVLYSGPAQSPEAQAALQTLRADLEKHRAFAAIAAPAPLTVVRRLQAPFASARKAARIWPAMLDVQLPFPIETAQILFADEPPLDKQASTLAAAIRTDDLTDCLDQSRGIGLDPTHCDVEAFALWAGHTTEKPAARGQTPVVLVWIGGTHTVFIRGIGNTLTSVHTLRHAHPLQPGDAASRQAFLPFFAGRFSAILEAHKAETAEPLFNVWWCGPAAADKTFSAALQNVVPAPGGITLRHGTHNEPASFLARSLARRAWLNQTQNFLTGSFSHPITRYFAQRARRRLYFGVAAAALLLLALNLFWHAHLTRRSAELQSELFRAARAIAGPSLQRGQERLMVERAVAQRDAETAPFRRSMDPVGLEGRLGALLDAAQTNGLEISLLRLSSGALTLEGSAPHIEAVDSLAARLEENGWTIQVESPGQSPEGKPLFVLKGISPDDHGI